MKKIFFLALMIVSFSLFGQRSDPFPSNWKQNSGNVNQIDIPTGMPTVNYNVNLPNNNYQRPSVVSSTPNYGIYTDVVNYWIRQQRGFGFHLINMDNFDNLSDDLKLKINEHHDQSFLTYENNNFWCYALTLTQTSDYIKIQSLNNSLNNCNLQFNQIKDEQMKKLSNQNQPKLFENCNIQVTKGFNTPVTSNGVSGYPMGQSPSNVNRCNVPLDDPDAQEKQIPLGQDVDKQILIPSNSGTQIDVNNLQQ